LSGQIINGLPFGSPLILTVGDIDVIDRLGIRLVIDFRATHERECWPSRGVFPTWARDYDTSNADLGRMLRNPATTVDKCRATMVRTYRDLPEEQAESYTELFHRIAAGDLPILFHCAVGKDRTGVAAALLLALLGVSRDNRGRLSLDVAGFRTDRVRRTRCD
jgi:protein-tyrosine phosphatase